MPVGSTVWRILTRLDDTLLGTVLASWLRTRTPVKVTSPGRYRTVIAIDRRTLRGAPEEDTTTGIVLRTRPPPYKGLQNGSVSYSIRKADPADKAEVYRQLGLRLNYQPETQTVRAEVDLSAHRGVIVCVRGATRPVAPPPMALRATLRLTQV